MTTVRLLIKGRVQGVFYRATAQEVAYETGVRGWIKNTKEGAVEALISGTEEQIKQFVAWCKKGPKRAVVSEVLIFNEEVQHFGDFRIIK